MQTVRAVRFFVGESRSEYRVSNKELSGFFYSVMTRKEKLEKLKEEGKRYYSFVFPEALMDLWIKGGEDTGIKPNERLLELIKKDMKGE